MRGEGGRCRQDPAVSESLVWLRSCAGLSALCAFGVGQRGDRHCVASGMRRGASSLS